MDEKPTPIPPGPTRTGPRPLPLHLAAEMMSVTSSRAAWPSLRNGSFGWKPHLQPEADRLKRDLAAADPDSFAHALEKEYARRMDGFLTGIDRYRHSAIHRTLPDAPIVLQTGTTRLLDYSLPGATGQPVLLIPSLINRAYILDLSPRRSLARALAEKGLRPFLVDWDAPGETETDFDLDAYILRLSALLDAVTARAGPPVLVGYCMGGLLALALGILRQPDILGLALLATPWDFHRPDPTQARILERLRQPIDDALEIFGFLPVDLLQIFFTLVDTGNVPRKFRSFAAMAPDSRKARDFILLEDWLNDGVPLTAKVARQSLFGWYAGNTTGRGEWRVAGTTIDPGRFVKPALVLIPSGDRLVPPASALALADGLPHARKRVTTAGHIGMVVGTRARTNCYGYLARWITGQTT